MAGGNERCRVLGEIPDGNQEFDIAHLEAVGCTLRCALADFPVKEIQVYQSDDLSLYLDNGRFADPGLDETWVSDANIVITLFLVLILVQRLAPTIFGLIGNRKITEKIANRQREAMEPKNTDIDSMTVLELREILRDRGLKISGSKEELKQRIKEKE